MKYILFIIPALFFSNPCLADGLPIKNGRYFGDKTIIIKPTLEQNATIKASYAKFFPIILTKEQQAKLKVAKYIDNPPTNLKLLKIDDTAGECTCGISNIGLLLKNGNIEVPLRFIYSDEEVGKRKIVD